jgi:hypothetical protein
MRIQFSLRTLFAVVTVAAVACAWLAHEARVVQERKALREWIVRRGGICGNWNDSYPVEQSFLRRWLGDEPIGFIMLPEFTTDADEARAKLTFPGALFFPRNMLSVDFDRPPS